MSNTSLLSVLLFVVLFVVTVRSQIFDEDEVINSLLLRRLRRSYGAPSAVEFPRVVDFVVEPKRNIRNSRYSDYTPTPCRWKLCASLFGY
ncbi:unnamed protein product [Bursaphelenchus okinawaensis]|uniref:Uncharacterized protein n=1 Tax=Bursaphelenchus okinawaensis TaxID=465554 RepID=A0A811KHX4_9BILA|nr:unnamed protein product [Bursaphelenchus okinawaensis]CAG9103215.1 unnamed protein product [Bursaphelenchus okinawaensis]